MLEIKEQSILNGNIIYIGKRAQLVMERLIFGGMMKLNEYPFCSLMQFQKGIDEINESDINVMVIDADEISDENLFDVGMVSRDLDPIIFSIGEYKDSDVKKILQQQTKCFFFNGTDCVEKYVASILKDFLKALSGKSVINIDTADVQSVISNPNNFVWYGKGFGNNKGTIIANQLQSCKWLQKVMHNRNPNLLVLLSGDLSLSDCSMAITSICENYNGKVVISSVCYEEEPYEEMTLLLMGSY